MKYIVDEDGRSLEAMLAFGRILRAGRTRVDPANEWSDFQPPLTEDQLAAARDASRQMESGCAPESFTCDDCAARYVCCLVFDWYNTDGDCLAIK